jgi:hypothetical protein
MLKVMNDNINATMTGQISPQAALNLIAKKQASILAATGRYPAYK